MFIPHISVIDQRKHIFLTLPNLNMFTTNCFIECVEVNVNHEWKPTKTLFLSDGFTKSETRWASEDLSFYIFWQVIKGSNQLLRRYFEPVLLSSETDRARLDRGHIDHIAYAWVPELAPRYWHHELKRWIIQHIALNHCASLKCTKKLCHYDIFHICSSKIAFRDYSEVERILKLS